MVQELLVSYEPPIGKKPSVLREGPPWIPARALKLSSARRMALESLGKNECFAPQPVVWVVKRPWCLGLGL